MNRQRPEQDVHALFLHVEHLPRALVEGAKLAQTHRGADGTDLEPRFEGGARRRTQRRRIEGARFGLGLFNRRGFLGNGIFDRRRLCGRTLDQS